MKKAIILIITIFFSISCFGQQIMLSASARTQLPKGVQKLNKEELKSFANKKFGNDKMALNVVADINSDNVYTINDVLVSLNTENAKVKDGHLLQLKKGLDEMSKKDKSYSSLIKTINNNQVLIINEVWGKVGYYRFYLFDDPSANAVAGLLEYNKDDEGKALNVLNNLLENMKFSK